MSDTEMRELGGTNIAMVFQGLMSALNPVFSVGHRSPMRDYLRPPFIPPFWLIISILSMVGLDQIEGGSALCRPIWAGWDGS